MAALTSRSRRLTTAAGVIALAAGVATGGQLAASAQSLTAPSAEFLTLSGVSTKVDLDNSTLAVLAQNGVSVTPVAPATVFASGGTTTATFPITEGYVAVFPQSQVPFIRGAFSHSGGLTFTAGGKSITATNFIVNPGTSKLTATVGGNSVQLLDLDGTNVKVTQDGATTRIEGTVAKLSSTAASALNSTFGVTLFTQGIPLGVVRIAAQGTAGPGGAPAAEFVELGGRSTSVDIDAGTLGVLTQNGVSVAPVAPATVTSSGGTTTASFPIAQGYVSVYPETQAPFIRGTFTHVGGLTFSAGGTSITATDFVVNPGTSSLTATVGGNPVKLLDLDGTNVKITPDGSTTRIEGTIAKLSADAARALNATFGVTLFTQGIPLGVVRIAAIAGPPPAVVGNATASQTSTTAPAGGSVSQVPSGGVATGGGGTAGGTSPFGGALPMEAVALVAIMVAAGGVWGYRARAQRAG